jgi:hypothetical protein
MSEEPEMKLIENRAEKVELIKRGATGLQVPALNAVVRERAAQAMNEPRFREFSRERQMSPPVAPIVDSPKPGATNLQSVLVALCSMGLGALMTFIYVGGHRGASADVATSNPTEQVSSPGFAIRAPAAMPSARVEIPTNDPKTEAMVLVDHWAKAWSLRDVERYLKFYSKSFVPSDNLSLENWEGKRRSRILGRKHISVAISDLRVELLDDNRAIAQFAQTYQADNYLETRANKILILAREDNAWRIAAEMNPRDTATQVYR